MCVLFIMDPEARSFTYWVKNCLPDAFVNTSVWDVGGGDINGNNQALFQNSVKYVCNDVGPAPNVTHVCKTSELPMEGRLFDVVISTECFQHDYEYAKSFNKILDSLKSESVFCFTCASTGRGEHGTRRTTPNDSWATKVNVKNFEDYYKNLTIDDVSEAIDLSFFDDLQAYYNSRSKDLYFVGVKGSKYLLNDRYSDLGVSLVSSANTISIQRERIVVCFFGVVSRSIQYTHRNLKDRLLSELEKEYDVETFVFNNIVDNTSVDGVVQTQHHVSLLPATYKTEKRQSVVDSEIAQTISDKNVIIRMRRDYLPWTIRNAIRQLYAEHQVGEFLKSHGQKYRGVIVCGADYYLFKPISLEDVRLSLASPNIIYTTTMNDAEGYTNGLFFGSVDPMIKVLDRYSVIETLFPTDHDYEYLFKVAFERNGIERSTTDLPFCKIRSNSKLSIDYLKGLRERGVTYEEMMSLCRHLKRQPTRNAAMQYQ